MYLSVINRNISVISWNFISANALSLLWVTGAGDIEEVKQYKDQETFRENSVSCVKVQIMFKQRKYHLRDRE